MNSFELQNYLYDHPAPNDQSFILGMIALENHEKFKLKQFHVQQNLPDVERSIAKIFVFYENIYWNGKNTLSQRECETFLKISLQMSRTLCGDFHTQETEISIQDFIKTPALLNLEAEQWIEHFTSTFLKKTLLNQIPETSKQNVKIKI